MNIRLEIFGKGFGFHIYRKDVYIAYIYYNLEKKKWDLYEIKTRKFLFETDCLYNILKFMKNEYKT
jgi:hypothetical protein